MRKLFIIIFCACLSASAYAQIVVQFVPELQGRTTDGLQLAKMTNVFPETQTVSLDIIVTEKKTGRVVQISTAPFTLLPGVNSIDRNAVSASTIRFADNNTARLLRQSGVFPEGEYDYCFQVYKQNKTSRGELLAEQCFDHLVEPLTPLFLIEPYLKDKICDKRPSFTWQPSLPAIPGLQYRLTLAEMKTGQVASEALVYNLPLINQSNILSPMLIFPPSAKELEEGKTYAWQVTVYKEGMILNRSEIWEFSIKCNDTPKVEPVDGFRDIEDLAKGNYYIANGSVRFALYNAYEATNLQYSFFCLNKPDQTFKHLPKIKLKRGSNNISIDLSENESFIDGYHYILTVRMPNNTLKKLRFLYKSGQ
ncbi:hypothetical protein [Longitalea arenae]|uniref:hypothetical protein n=1 Tax=Longitalea arenae TaxID=2812558 RepID=UPI0019684983|nr:hypothetical protein [Longitalea arenae]